MKSGISPHANGSAYLEVGQTKVICTVYEGCVYWSRLLINPKWRFGPRESTKADFREKARLNCDFKFTTFSKPGAKTAFIADDEGNMISLVLSVYSFHHFAVCRKTPISYYDASFGIFNLSHQIPQDNDWCQCTCTSRGWRLCDFLLFSHKFSSWFKALCQLLLIVHRLL